MYDLNVTWPGKDRAGSVLKFALSKGWSTIGFNVYYKADAKGVHPLDLEFEVRDNIDIDHLPSTASVTGLMTSVLGNSLCSNSGEDLSLGNNFVRRVTVILLDGFKPNSLVRFADSKDFDIFSIVPTCQRSFNSACESLNCDLINMNIYCLYAPFKIKRGMITVALQRGCYFEVSLSNDEIYKKLDVLQSLKCSVDVNDLNVKYQSHLPMILRHIPLNKLIVSSGSLNTSDIISPKLLVGVCNNLFKFIMGKPCNTFECITKSPKGCISKGAARRTYGTGIVSCHLNDTLGNTFE